MQLIFFLVLFVALFFLSRILTTTLTLFFFRITKSNTFAVQLLAILFLPGVIVHELAHWFVASILFVQTGDIEFLPQVQGDTVKLGSVQIAKTDPVRRFIIGVAPIVFGLLVLLGIFWLLTPSFSPLTWKTGIFLYAVFEIGNTMFSSKKDLEGAVGFFILAFLFLFLLLFLKVPVFSFVAQLLYVGAVQSLFSTLITFFVLAIGVDALSIGVFRLLLQLVW